MRGIPQRLRGRDSILNYSDNISRRLGRVKE